MQRSNGSKVVSLAGKDLPRAANEDVKFDSLEHVQEFFSDDEIVTLCERAIYQAEYQRTHHKKYSQKLRDLEKPVKEMAKKMFPGISYINLTDEQHATVLKAVMPEREEGE